jgi:DNA-binding transcriptional LysR family regulator
VDLKNTSGDEVVASVRPVLVLDDPEAIAHAAACGMGIGMLPMPHALPLLDSGALVRVLPDWFAETRPLSIYYSSRKLVPAKVRVSSTTWLNNSAPAATRRASATAGNRRPPRGRSSNFS